MHTTITQEQLKGLKFHTHKKIKVQEDGKEIDRFIPDQVDLVPEHLLSAKDKGDHLSIVSGDGLKHKIPKGGKGKK